MVLPDTTMASPAFYKVPRTVERILHSDAVAFSAESHNPEHPIYDTVQQLATKYAVSSKGEQRAETRRHDTKDVNHRRQP